MIDIVLLRVLKYQKDYRQLVHSLPSAALDEKTKALVADFGKYFDKFPEHERVDLQVFIPRFRSWHPTMAQDTFNSYVSILRNIQEDVDDSTKAGIVCDLYEADAAVKIANACAQYDSGDLDAPLADLVSSIIDGYKANIGARELKWNDKDIADILEADLNMAGVRWRLNTLNECMRPLRPGDFGIIAGRPDKGKTTFLASEIPFLASQIPDDQNVVWLNNEGVSDTIVKRLWQGALGCTVSECLQYLKEKKLHQMYAKAVGRWDKIRVFDIHGFHIGQVEAILEQNQPGLILFDMIDNIHGFGSAARTDLQLEKMYQWARERCVKYSCIGLATSQISAEGDGIMFPTLSMLKDSKTGKQGACDFQLMIGASNDPNLQNSRYLSLPKNKLRRDGCPGDPQKEIKYQPLKARYEDVAFGT